MKDPRNSGKKYQSDGQYKFTETEDDYESKELYRSRKTRLRTLAVYNRPVSMAYINYGNKCVSSNFCDKHKRTIKTQN